jgi:hypothetical protein
MSALGSLGAGLRLIVGWISVLVGVLGLGLELDRGGGSPDGAYLLFHAMLVIGGVLLISLPRIGAPGLAGYAAGGAVMCAGVLGSALPVNDAGCCMTAFAVRHGYPFILAARTEDGARWHVDGERLVADLLFWGYAGLIVLVVVALTRRATKHHTAAEHHTVGTK